MPLLALHLEGRNGRNLANAEDSVLLACPAFLQVNILVVKLFTSSWFWLKPCFVRKLLPSEIILASSCRDWCFTVLLERVDKCLDSLVWTAMVYVCQTADVNTACSVYSPITGLSLWKSVDSGQHFYNTHIHVLNGQVLSQLPVWSWEVIGSNFCVQ